MPRSTAPMFFGGLLAHFPPVLGCVTARWVQRWARTSRRRSNSSRSISPRAKRSSRTCSADRCLPAWSPPAQNALPEADRAQTTRATTTMGRSTMNNQPPIIIALAPSSDTQVDQRSRGLLLGMCSLSRDWGVLSAGVRCPRCLNRTIRARQHQQPRRPDPCHHLTLVRTPAPLLSWKRRRRTPLGRSHIPGLPDLRLLSALPTLPIRRSVVTRTPPGQGRWSRPSRAPGTNLCENLRRGALARRDRERRPLGEKDRWRLVASQKQCPGSDGGPRWTADRAS